ncbi:hypothetical protein KY285_010890 [Solanum tuberosum]|nr:hypothetical protein KY289_011464 [Solanum tuberosum]KAH0735183.1 hypothetical protein KY285_010890 [Solanum tuberosum]
MIDEVEIVFNDGGSWVVSPLLVYTKKLVHYWLNFDPELLSHKDICDEFTSRLGLSRVKQLLVTGPFGKYYIVDGDDGIRAILSLLCEKFKVVNFFVVEEGELIVFAQNITQYSESCLVDVEVGTDCEHSAGDRLENFKELQVGMTFKDMKEGRQVLNYYALANKRDLTIIKGHTKRTRYGCDAGCPFRCLISRDGKTEGFKIKTFINKHTCEETFFNARADTVTLAQYFKNKLQNNPKYKVKDMRGELENDLKLNVCQSKLKRAKRMALEKLEGSFIDDYNKLEAYAQELKQSNPGSDVLINISKDALAEGKRNFLRMYMCFDALKKGWKSGLRPLIGLDGTFLKGICKGMMLVALGQDSMNSFYPLAWAIVDKETSRTWRWFIELLKGSLDLKDGAKITFISDMQKGLIDVVDKVLPEAQHWYCVRHMESNWCKRWRSGQMRKLMWWCAWSSYDEEFKDQLNKLGKLSNDGARDLVKYPPKAWCRAYFDTQCKNMMVDNNFTESFNA